MCVEIAHDIGHAIERIRAMPCFRASGSIPSDGTR